jgi:hypothetical protein
LSFQRTSSTDGVVSPSNPLSLFPAILVDRSAPASVNQPDAEESLLRLFCLRYWGRGAEGRRAIYQTRSMVVPYLNDPKDREVAFDTAESEDESEDVAGDAPDPNSVDLANRTLKTRATTASPVSYTALSLGLEFKGFFPNGHDEILVRDEYLAMVNHIKTIQKQPHRHGVVVMGQPGIGEELSQYL